jgi:hypothetical protein
MSSETPELAQQVAELSARLDELGAKMVTLKDLLLQKAMRADGLATRTREERILKPEPPDLFERLLRSLQHPSPTIVGGEETDLFPDCCAVGNPSGFFCSGVLVAPNVVLSAGHCTGSTLVFLKGSDVNVPADGERIAIAQSFRHPDRDLRALVLEHASQVKPRHVAQGAEIGNPTLGTLVGFGDTDPDGTSGYGKKRQVEVPIESLDCTSPGDAQKFNCVPGVEMVVGHPGLMRDGCDGDSGGPLYIKNVNGDFHLLGIYSRGTKDIAHNCGDGSICLRVDKFLDWIRAQTGVAI